RVEELAQVERLVLLFGEGVSVIDGRNDVAFPGERLQEKNGLPGRAAVAVREEDNGVGPRRQRGVGPGETLDAEVIVRLLLPRRRVPEHDLALAGGAFPGAVGEGDFAEADRVRP